MNSAAASPNSMVTARPALSLCDVRSPMLAVVLAAAAVIVPAQDANVNLEGRRIVRVDFDPPDQPVPRAELDRLLPFHAGSIVTAAGTRAAIQDLYQTGRYSNISIDGALNQNGEVIVTISTSRAYFNSGMTFVGAAEPPTKGQLETAAKLEAGGAVFRGRFEARRGQHPRTSARQRTLRIQSDLHIGNFSGNRRSSGSASRSIPASAHGSTASSSPAISSSRPRASSRRRAGSADSARFAGRAGVRRPRAGCRPG